MAHARLLAHLAPSAARLIVGVEQSMFSTLGCRVLSFVEGCSEQKRIRSEGGKILLVDDMEANLDLLCELLESDGYDTALADGGALALRLADHIGPDLILLDVMMPRPGRIGGVPAVEGAAEDARDTGDFHNGPRADRRYCRGFQRWRRRLHH